MRAVLSGTSLTAPGFGRLDAGCEHASGEGRRLTEMRIVDALESGSDGGKWVRNAHGLEAKGDKWEGTGTEDHNGRLNRTENTTVYHVPRLTQIVTSHMHDFHQAAAFMRYIERVLPRVIPTSIWRYESSRENFISRLARVDLGGC
jgi:hypothetical protein